MDLAKPNDLITQREAAALVGRGVDSIRRWRREYGLEVFRDEHPTAPAMVSRAQVLAFAGQVKGGSTAETHPLKEYKPSQIGAPDAFLAQRAHIESLQAQVSDLMQRLSEERAYTEMLRKELTQLGGMLQERNQKVAALEKELTGGLVRGLLTGARRRLGI